MGALDDAIREHLELKRRLGASEEEVKRKEQEAFGRGSAIQPPASETSPEGDGPGLQEASLPAEPSSLTEPEVNGNGPAAAPLPDELDPDEVLPEESLELEPTRPPADWEEELELDDDRGAGGDSDDDVLDATPDFFEERADQDQLWFEQKSPKDFDFD